MKHRLCDRVSTHPWYSPSKRRHIVLSSMFNYVGSLIDLRKNHFPGYHILIPRESQSRRRSPASYSLTTASLLAFKFPQDSISNAPFYFFTLVPGTLDTHNIKTNGNRGKSARLVPPIQTSPLKGRQAFSLRHRKFRLTRLRDSLSLPFEHSKWYISGSHLIKPGNRMHPWIELGIRQSIHASIDKSASSLYGKPITKLATPPGTDKPTFFSLDSDTMSGMDGNLI